MPTTFWTEIDAIGDVVKTTWDDVYMYIFMGTVFALDNRMSDL